MSINEEMEDAGGESVANKEEKKQVWGQQIGSGCGWCLRATSGLGYKKIVNETLTTAVFFSLSTVETAYVYVHYIYRFVPAALILDESVVKSRSMKYSFAMVFSLGKINDLAIRVMKSLRKKSEATCIVSSIPHEGEPVKASLQPSIDPCFWNVKF